MKNLYAFATALLLSVSASAQVPPIGFATRFGDPTETNSRGVGVDALGNAYTCGLFSGTTTVGSQTITSAGNNDVFVAKHDEQGNGIWVRGFGWVVDDLAHKIAVDEQGNSFVLARWSVQITVDGTTYTSNNDSRDVCVIKLDANGDVQWFSAFGGTLEDVPQDIGLDADGNILVTGYFNQNLTVAGDSFTSNSTDAFLVKLDPDGTPLWTRVLAATGGSYGRALAVDAMGNCYVTGTATGTVDAGMNTFTIGTGYSIFLVKYDAAGVDQWAQSPVTSTNIANAWGLAADAAGNTYMVGSFDDQLQIGGFSLVANGNLFADAYIAKFNTAGVVQWAYKMGGASSELGWEVIVDSNGNPYVIGDFSGSTNVGGFSLTSDGGVDVFLTKLDPAGSFLWATRIGGSSNNHGFGLATHPNGNCYATGAFLGSMLVGTELLVSAGDGDAFLVKYGTELVTGVPQLERSASKVETGRYNVLGQQVNALYNGLRIVRYSDGSSARKMTLEQ
ncbi:MAG: hypothetical protein IPM12_04690 [Flavobacteriales bacterium]|nr:hypothetical protein [Flavobacteriales bacterium]